MNIQDYISSGIIETYVLGLAGEEEARELERLCLEYPEIKEALLEAQESLESYAQLHAMQPSSDVKNQIWNAINDEETNENKGRIDNTVKQTKNISKVYFYLAIAACLLLAIALPYHIYKINQYQTEISTLKKEKIEILAQNKTFQTQTQQAKE